MPYDNFWEARGLYRVFSGEIKGDEVFSSNVAVQADPRFPSIDYILNDFTGISGHDIDASHTRVYAKTDKIIAGSKRRLKIAVVVHGSTQMRLALGYRAMMYDSSFDCEVFSDLPSARAWAEATAPAPNL